MSYAAVSVGLFILLIAFFTLNAPSATPSGLPASSTVATSSAVATGGHVSGFCEEVDPTTAPTFQAPADWATKTKDSGAPAGSKEVTSDCGADREVRHLFSPNLTTYQMIRKGVPLSTRDVKGKTLNFEGEGSCHFDSAQSISIDTPGVDTTKYKVFFPEISGEISIDGKLPSRTRGRDSDLLYFIDYGLVFLLYLHPDGTFTKYEGGTTQGEQETFYLADVYHDIDSGRPDLPPDTFKCDGQQGANAVLGGTTVEVPTQNINPKADQLQLQYFVFSQSGGEVVNGWGIHCKPAIYLYPPKKELVNVKVYPSGFLTYTDPLYNSNTGWTVWANPNGKLETNEQRATSHDYLYFESKIHDEVIEKPTKGWVIKSPESKESDESKDWFKPLEDHFHNILPKLGLNAQQTNDFIEYWEKTLPKSPYYFVGIINQDNVNQIEKLEITPKPDSINRVRVYFERLDQPKPVEAPILTSDEKRETSDEFQVVEWGGMVKNDLNHPFTCSQ